MLNQGCGRELSLRFFRRQFVFGISKSNLKGKYGTITKRYILLI